MGSEGARISSSTASSSSSSEVGSDTRVSNAESSDFSAVEEARVSSSELDSREPCKELEARVSEIKAEDDNLDGGKSGARFSDIKVENLSLASGNGGFGAGNAGIRVFSESGVEPRVSRIDEDFAVLRSQEDEVDTRDMLVLDALAELSHGFEYGDMVWGKVKSHPWWPGHIFNEAFASSSVRRMKRDGHVLVAFFGDSSYGWFDPAELIPFEPYYAEKSQQTNLRNFMKAVEEAVDEVKRRCALGLACQCRNPSNFRPVNVDGYFEVDVEDYDSGMVYSGKQIKKARENFQPVKALSFVQQLALMPRDGEEHGSMSWIQNVSTLLAYRKAVFEDFDETYAQAFGMQPIRPSRGSLVELGQPERVPPRAPLSGPLVVAENLGEGKKPFSKPIKAKKDKYLFKRRDEPNDERPVLKPGSHNGSLQSVLFTSMAFQDSSASFSRAGEYVLQRRAAPLVERHPSVSSQLPDDKHGSEDGKVQQGLADNRKAVVEEMAERMRADEDVGPTNKISNTSTWSGKLDSSGMLERVDEKDACPEPSFSESGGIDGLVRMGKVIKRQQDDSGPDKGEVKKMKKKKDSNRETSIDHPKKHLRIIKDGDSMKRSAGKSIGISFVEQLQAESQNRDGAGSSVLNSSGPVSPPKLDIENIDMELPQLVSDLLVLALDPFHGIERNAPGIARQVFLKFRSLVYQKSLVLLPASESEAPEVRPKSSMTRLQQESGSGNAEFASGEERGEPMSGSKSMKQIKKSDDPTKMGRKRSPSDRQEEMSAKRLKKLNDMKALVAEKKASQAEKKASQKMVDGQKGDQKETGTPTPTKHIIKPPAKPVVPTALVMKFPPRTALPSESQLKAKFAWFGPLDLSGTRVYWRSSTCRVVFKHKSDAQDAYDHAIRNNTLFGQFGVKYQLRAVDAPTVDATEASKRDGPEDVQQPRPSGGGDVSGGEPRPMVYRQPQPAVQLKSCLKKPSGDDVGPIMKESPRVKFLLGDEQSRRGEQLETVNNNSSNGDGASSYSQPLDVNTLKNVKPIVVLPPALPFPPLPSPPLRIPEVHENHHPMAVQFGNVHPSNYGHLPPRYSSVEGRNSGNGPRCSEVEDRTTGLIDISHPMLSLLMRCSDIVTDLKGALGYIPYHPL